MLITLPVTVLTHDTTSGDTDYNHLEKNEYTLEMCSAQNICLENEYLSRDTEYTHFFNVTLSLYCLELHSTFILKVDILHLLICEVYSFRE